MSLLCLNTNRYNVVMNLLFLDTETTGNDPRKDRLCQICFKVDGNLYAEMFHPPIPISVKAMSITHITNKMVANKNIFQNDNLYKTLQSFLTTHILVAHNAKFDTAILHNEGIEVPQYICTLKVARFLDTQDKIPEYNLQFLRYFLDMEIEAAAHDATGDVLVLEALFTYQFNSMMKQYQDEHTVIQKMIEISSKPFVFHKIPFGKHKGKYFTDLIENDREYLLWLLNDKLLKQPDDEDWIYTLQYYLNSKTT